jgi:hypothetical protein
MARPKNPPVTHEHDPDDFINAPAAAALFYSIVGIKSGFAYHNKAGNIAFNWGKENDNNPNTDKYVSLGDNRCVMYRVAAIEREAKEYLSNRIKTKKTA